MAGMALRVAVVGAGILGLAVARRIQERAGAAVTVFEKQAAVARHQTGHNSGVVHAGLYYSPGSLKAQLCQQGRTQLRDYCRSRQLPYDECGKVVVARDTGELPRLTEIERRARANSVPDLCWLDANGLRQVEPHAAGVAALHSPHTAITNFAAVAGSLAAELVAEGGELRLSTEVTGISSLPASGRGGRGAGRGSVVVGVHTAEGNDAVEVDRLVVCAGLQSDRVARLAGDDADPAIVPFRGEYLRLVPARSGLVRGLIYPVPDPAYPFLGVHFTRRVDGGVDVGPNAVLATAREGYRRRDVSVRDVWDTVRFPGFRHLVRRHWRTGAREVWGSLSLPAFVARARQYVPELGPSDVAPAPAGVRAQAVEPDGTLVDDFRIGGRGSVITVRNAPSPGATSALAIADHLVELVL
jgi:L-2-hydroxyglutarate oxidase LhgO